MKFIELNPEVVSGSWFPCTNEEPELHRHHLEEVRKGRRLFQRAASICSGGEIPIFVLLLKCKEVFAIDNSYVGLTAAYTKALLIKEVEPETFLDLMSKDNSWPKLEVHLKEIKPKLPKPFQKMLFQVFTKWGNHSLRREMQRFSVEDIKKIKRRLNRLTFVHGYFTDAGQFGPFDVFYLSNALEYRTDKEKNKKLRDLLDLRKMGKEKSPILFTGPDTPQFSLKIKETPGKRTTWRHQLYVLKEQLNEHVDAASPDPR